MRLVWLPDALTFDLSDMTDLTLLWGLEGVVLRFVGSASQRVPHVNEARIRNRFREGDIEVAAIDPGIFEGEVRDRPTWWNEVYTSSAVFDFCSRLNCSVVQVSAFARSPGGTADDVMIPFRAMLGRHDGSATIAIKNEPWSCVSTAESLVTLIGRLDRPALGASWCPATSFRMGEDLADVVARIAPVLVLLRCSDVRKDSGRHVAFGSGDVPWSMVFESLVSAQFDGIVSLELPKQSTRTEGLRAASALIAACREARATTEK